VTAGLVVDEEEDLDDSYIVVLVAKGGVRLKPGDRLELNGYQTDAGLATVFLMTRFQDIGLPERLPQELVFEVRCPGRDIDDAVARAAALTTSLVPLISFTVNSFVDIPRAHLAYEASPGRHTRRFWQEDVLLGVEPFTPAQVLRRELFFSLLQDIYTHAERRRLARAVSQYHAALRHWSAAGQPLALMHLWPALEALGPAVERAERQRLGLEDEQAHARHHGLDLDEDDKWKLALLGRIRRDVICRGDELTYKTAYTARNGLFHASKDMSFIRGLAPQIAPKLFDYIRLGILDLLNLDDDVRGRLARTTLLDITPLHAVMKGVLSGDVADADKLGFGGDPYPRMESDIKIEAVTYQPDGRLTVTPTFTYTVQTASEVQFTPMETALATGINDPAKFETAAPAPGGPELAIEQTPDSEAG
jgi:hypothetical protein